jgi:hypothetical protein
MRAAWLQVGLAQRDLPVHVINEYCREDRSFLPLPAFNEDKLPRILTYYNCKTRSTALFFPLVVSDSTGLGVDFALFRGTEDAAGTSSPPDRWAERVWFSAIATVEVEAVGRLNEVRTADLTQSRTNLGLIEPELDHGARLSL